MCSGLASCPRTLRYMRKCDVTSRAGHVLLPHPAPAHVVYIPALARVPLVATWTRQRVLLPLPNVLCKHPPI